MSGKRSRQIRKAQKESQRAAEAVVREAETAVRVAAIVAEIEERYYADLRRELAEASERHRAAELLAAALAPEHAYGWEPWGYEEPATAELPIVVPAPRPMVAQFRLIHGQPKPAPRARQQLNARMRELVAA